VECTYCHAQLPDGSRFCNACGADQSGGDGPAVLASGVELLRQRLQRGVHGKYEVLRLLGRGGMGAVFLAQDLTLDREVAIKVLPPEVSQDQKVVQRFQQEAKTAAKLDHTNIIPIYRVESDGGLNYFVMKYVSGTSLEDVVEQKKALPIDYVQRVLWEAACALGHAHQRGIVHRDVKPANIMFDHDGRVMLTDFGISKALQAASVFTGTGIIIGTPHYMAPEQAKGQTVDGRADQYSLGVVGYRLITGQLPFSGDSVHTILYKHIFEDPPTARDVRQDVPAFLAAAVRRAMAKDPAQRFATMEEFATAVWPEQPVTAGRSGPVTLRPRSSLAVSSELPTERVAAPPMPVTPVPASGRRSAPRVDRATGRPRPSSGGWWAVFLLLVIGGGVGGYLYLQGSGRAAGRGAGAPPAATPTAPELGPVDVRVTPSTAQLRVGGSITLQAQAVDARGVPVVGTAVTWSSSAPHIVRVDSLGRVTAVAPGLAMIDALAGGARGQAAVSVTAPPAQVSGPARSPELAAPVAEQRGFISINATPAATVFINGVEAGETPLGNYPVRPGRVTIRLEAPGYRILSEQVTVEPGQTVRRTHALIPEG
jgi:serine/threonine protein kinase